MQMKITTVILLDQRRPKKDNTFPVKLRITFERKQKYYPTQFDLTEKEFEAIMYGQRKNDAAKQVFNSLQAYENKAREIINQLPFFSFETFEKKYYSNRAAKDTINDAFENYINELKAAGRIGTAVSYGCAQSSLKKFAKGAKFTDITPDFLRKYEKWMLGDEKSVTTVGIYLRQLRALFNSAIAEGLLSKELYPFGKRKYEIPVSRNIKKALPINVVKAIYEYKTKEAKSTEAMAKDFWLFMYFCNGINVKDMCLLKYENIKGEVLEFERAKTARTKRNIEPIRVSLGEDLKAIIKKWGNKKRDEKDFIFPVLTKGLSPERERQLIQQLTQVVNCHMKTIAANLGIESKLTTYVARHTFSTILQRSGANISLISEALGHSNSKTTQSYLGGFEDESKKEITAALTAFKNTTTQRLDNNKKPLRMNKANSKTFKSSK